MNLRSASIGSEMEEEQTTKQPSNQATKPQTRFMVPLFAKCNISFKRVYFAKTSTRFPKAAPQAPSLKPQGSSPEPQA